MEDHVIKVLTNRIASYGSREAIRFREQTRRSLSWKELGTQVEQVMNSLRMLGCREGDNVGIFSPNRAEWIIADLGIMANRCVTVPMYATSSDDQLRYILEETNIKVLFVGTEQQLDLVRTFPDDISSLEKIVVFDDRSIDDERILTYDEFLELSVFPNQSLSLNDRLKEYRSDDTATIIYSSGTTGAPKGIVLKHHHFIFAFRIHDQRLEIKEQDVSMSFLPLSHVFERMWTHLMLHSGAICVFLENPREVMDALTTVKPSLMCTVPRFFDKTYQGIQSEVSSWPSVKRKIFQWAMNSGLKANAYRSRSASIPLVLKGKLAISEALVFKRLRDVFGGNIRIMPCAGATLNTDMLKFFHAMGLFVLYGYGLTETTASVSCFCSDQFEYGTCGTVMPEVEVKIGDNNEILVRGGNVFSGYYKNKEATDAVMSDGWFHTGDEGRLDEDGNLVMVDRLKDMMKTSVGKYVSPQKIELLLGEEDVFEQVVVIGDDRPYMTALIVPDMSRLKAFAESHDIFLREDSELLTSNKVQSLLKQRLEKMQSGLPSYEKVVDFILLGEPFSMEEGTMTNTLKLRRKKIQEKYHDLIEEMYRA
ncbi:MAG: AMP-dependent synthetase/ligase [Bacteroidota bacterium]